MIAHGFRLIALSCLAFIIKAMMTIVGLVAVAIGVRFCIPVPGTLRPFSNHPGGWSLVRLPRWLLWWDNPYDGLLGDKRGDWAQMCQYAGLDCRDLWAMWLWAAVRNPANYFSRHVIGVDVSNCLIEKLAGNDVVVEEPGCRGWQFLTATPVSGPRRYRLFVIWPWFFKPTRAVMLDIGWKIKLSHNGTAPDAAPNDRFKGFVFTASPWKTLA